jgi:hypothetical protein
MDLSGDFQQNAPIDPNAMAAAGGGGSINLSGGGGGMPGGNATPY